MGKLDPLQARSYSKDGTNFQLNAGNQEVKARGEILHKMEVGAKIISVKREKTIHQKSCTERKSKSLRRKLEILFTRNTQGNDNHKKYTNSKNTELIFRFHAVESAWPFGR